MARRGESCFGCTGEGKGQELGSTESEDDIGLLDVLDLLEAGSAQLKDILDRINLETLSLGDRINERAKEVAEATLAAQGAVSRREAKRLVARAAADMDQYTFRMKNETPIFNTVMDRVMETMTRFAMIATQMKLQDLNETRKIRDAVAVLATKIGDA